MVAADATGLWRYCWMMLIRGAVWAGLVVTLLAQPDISIGTVTLIVGGIMVTEGVHRVVNAGNGVKQARWAGFVSIAMGVLTFWIRSIDAEQLLHYVACWAAATGIIEITVALWHGEGFGGRFWLALAGVATLAFGLSLLLRMRAALRSSPGLIATCGVPFVVILFTLALGAYTCMKLIEAQRSPRSNGLGGVSA